MTVLISGGSGFIGMNIAEALTAKGVNIVILANKPLLPEMEKALQKKQGNYAFFNVDILDGYEISRLVEHYKVTSIIHGAAISPGIDREPQLAKNIMNINLIGTFEMLEVARKNNIERFIYLSSASVYGEAAYEQDLLSEDKTFPRPDSFYAISKFAGERSALRYKQLFNMDIVAVRIGATFGPWEYNTGVRDTLSAPLLTTSFALNGQTVILPRDGHKDWLYSRDAANALVNLLFTKTLTYDLYNLSYGNTWSIREWCDMLTQEFPDFHYEIAETNLANISFYGDQDRSSLSNRRIQEDLNFKPAYGLEGAFADYMNWIKSVPRDWFST